MLNSISARLYIAGMDITISTPALLFPAISLLLLAYTNRFLALATLVRQLHGQYQERPDEILFGQINNLRQRLKIIRNMQALGAISFFMCVLAMLTLFLKLIILGELIFGISLIFLMSSLALSIWEIQISVIALNLQLKEIEEYKITRNMPKID